MQAEGIFLKALFDRLNKSGVCYAVMRNYELLPDTAGGSDLDLIASPENKVLVKAVLLAAIQAAGDASLIQPPVEEYFTQTPSDQRPTRSSLPSPSMSPAAIWDAAEPTYVHPLVSELR